MTEKQQTYGKENNFIKFLRGSKSYCGIEFAGMYLMPETIFIKALSHYLATGENVLDEYSQMVWVMWGHGPIDHNREGEFQRDLEDGYYSENEVDLISGWFAGNSYWDIYDILSKDQIKFVMKFLKQSTDYHKGLMVKKKRRSAACTFTSDPKRRDLIFSRDGYRCVRCNSRDNLCLDHIIPVTSGGEDSDDNLQTLCHSCNSKKGGRVGAEG